jgi:hypothetical protein
MLHIRVMRSLKRCQQEFRPLFAFDRLVPWGGPLSPPNDPPGTVFGQLGLSAPLPPRIASAVPAPGWPQAVLVAERAAHR